MVSELNAIRLLIGGSLHEFLGGSSLEIKENRRQLEASSFYPTSFFYNTLIYICTANNSISHWSIRLTLEKTLITGYYTLQDHSCDTQADPCIRTLHWRDFLDKVCLSMQHWITSLHCKQYRSILWPGFNKLENERITIDTMNTLALGILVRSTYVSNLDWSDCISKYYLWKACLV